MHGIKVRIDSFLFILSLLFIFLQSLKEQEANVKKYLNGDLEEELLDMLQHLHSAGMNYDINNSELSDQPLQPCTVAYKTVPIFGMLRLIGL